MRLLEECGRLGCSDYDTKLCKVERKDDTTVESETCNYVVIYHDEKEIRQLLIPLYQDKLESVVGELLSRLVPNTQLKEKLGTVSKLDHDLRPVLSSTILQQTPEDFAVELARMYDGELHDPGASTTRAVQSARTRRLLGFSVPCPCVLAEKQYSNTKDVLRKQLEGLREAGVPDLMEPTMPAAAHIVRHYERFLSLLA